MKQYKLNILQPIIAVAAKEMGKPIEEFLAHGADANTLEQNAHSILQDPSSARYKTGESLLDVVQKKLKALRKYKGEPENAPRKEPETLRDETFYTNSLLEGSYHHWTALRDFQSVKKTNAEARKAYEKSLEKKTIEGANEKKQAVKRLIQELESAENALLAAGAKTFADLHPNQPKQQQNTFNNQYNPNDPLPYETKLTFQVPDLNDTKRLGYHVLFEAAWSNDIDTIKSLTLASWETPNSDKSQVETAESSVRLLMVSISLLHAASNKT